MGQYSLRKRYRSGFHGSRRDTSLKHDFWVKAILRRGGKGHLTVRIPRDVMRRYLGEEECIFTIEAKGKVTKEQTGKERTRRLTIGYFLSFQPT